jgi:hypothetical protein
MQQNIRSCFIIQKSDGKRNALKIAFFLFAKFGTCMRKFLIEGYFLGENELYIDRINLSLKI